MTLTHTQEAPHHRRTRGTPIAAKAGQFTGALLGTGGATALALRYPSGVRAGLIRRRLGS